jgi:hypothetical protein
VGKGGSLEERSVGVGWVGARLVVVEAEVKASIEVGVCVRAL